MFQDSPYDLKDLIWQDGEGSHTPFAFFFFLVFGMQIFEFMTSDFCITKTDTGLLMAPSLCLV